MHFNNLLLGFRLKALGGVALAAVFVLGLKQGELAAPQIVTAVFVALALIWVLVWAADFFYYYRLLAGAVDELLRLETVIGDVRLSHLIERRVQGGKRPANDTDVAKSYSARYPGNMPSWPIRVFYAVPAVVLLMLAAAAWLAQRS